MTATPIPVLSASDFQRAATANARFVHEQPVIVTGYIEHWPGYENWRDIGRLRHRFGHLRAFAKAPNFVTNVNSKLVSVDTDFATYLDYIENPERVKNLFINSWIEGDYSQFCSMNMPLYCGTLRLVHHSEDPIFEELDPLLPKPLRHFNAALPYFYSLHNHLWLLVSLPGALTPLHIDNNGTIAIIAQLYGRKRATLYAPADLLHVRNPSVGFLDLRAPDKVDHPTWRQARPWVGELEPGQVLFVGTNWAHHVETLEKSISVSFDYVDSSNLRDYARSAGWASTFGERCKRKPELIARTMGAYLTTETLAGMATETVGRMVMIDVLRAAAQDPGNAETAAFRRTYLAHLEQMMNEGAIDLGRVDKKLQP